MAGRGISWFESPLPNMETDIFTRGQQNDLQTAQMGVTPEEIALYRRYRNNRLSALGALSTVEPQPAMSQLTPISPAQKFTQSLPFSFERTSMNRDLTGKSYDPLSTRTGLGFAGARTPEQEISPEQQQAYEQSMGDIGARLGSYQQRSGKSDPYARAEAQKGVETFRAGLKTQEQLAKHKQVMEQIATMRPMDRLKALQGYLNTLVNFAGEPKEGFEKQYTDAVNQLKNMAQEQVASRQTTPQISNTDEIEAELQRRGVR